MNSKKIILSIFVIIAIVLMASCVFAYDTKGPIPEVCMNQRYTNINPFLLFKKYIPTDLHILDVKLIKYTEAEDKTNCAEFTVRTNFRSIDTHGALSYIFSPTPNNGSERENYPDQMEKFYESVNANKEGKDGTPPFDIPGIVGISPNPNKITENGEFKYKIPRTYNTFCSRIEIPKRLFDVYVFKPEIYGAQAYQDDVLVCDMKNGRFHKIDFYDLRGKAKKLYKIGPETYFYNVDYAYGVPVTITDTGIPNPEGQPAETGDQPPASTDPKDENPAVPAIKPDVPNTEQEVQPTVPTPTSLKLKPLTSLKNITYNNIPARYVTESNTTITVIGDKTKDKNISITLPSNFNKDNTYAVILPINNFTDINTEIQKILSTGTFDSYAPQASAYNINFKLSKLLKFKPFIENNKTKINLSGPNAEDKMTIVFMQADGTNLNIAYAHLFVLDDNEQSTLYLCEINRNILGFYCKGYNCGLTPCGCTEPGCVCPYRELPSCISGLGFSNWETGFTGLEDQGTPEVTPPAEDTEIINTSNGDCYITKQENVTAYRDCLISNLKVWNKEGNYTSPSKKNKGTGLHLMEDKYKSANLGPCLNNTEFHNKIFSKAKELQLSQEETAQFWARIAAESGCKLSCGMGGCGSSGTGQINLSAWNGKNEYYNIDEYLIAMPNKERYDNYSKYFSSLNQSSTNPDISLEISTAIDKYNAKQLFKLGPFWKKEMETTYDHNDAIDIEFAKAYLYGASGYATLFSSGPTSNGTKDGGAAYTAFHKTGYYLGYKMEIYKCSKDASYTNNFIAAYKVNYPSGYCKKA